MNDTRGPRYYVTMLVIVLLIIGSTAFLVPKVVDEFRIRKCVKIVGQIYKIKEESFGSRIYIVRCVPDSLKNDRIMLLIDSSLDAGNINDYALINYDPASGWSQFAADSGYNLKFKILVAVITLLVVFLIVGI